MKIENENLDLLACPFCGSTTITVEWEACPPLDSTDTNRRWFAECTQCSCQGPFCQKETQVIPAWNKRCAGNQCHGELYALVEAYLCTPNTEPIIEDHYKSLVAWFVRNKQPDGSEPRPVAPDQQYLISQN